MGAPSAAGVPLGQSDDALEHAPEAAGVIVSIEGVSPMLY